MDRAEQATREGIAALRNDAAALVALGLTWTEAWEVPTDEVPDVVEALQAARDYYQPPAAADGVVTRGDGRAR